MNTDQKILENFSNFSAITHSKSKMRKSVANNSCIKFCPKIIRKEDSLKSRKKELCDKKVKDKNKLEID